MPARLQHVVGTSLAVCVVCVRACEIICPMFKDLYVVCRKSHLHT